MASDDNDSRRARSLETAATVAVVAWTGCGRPRPAFHVEGAVRTPRATFEMASLHAFFSSSERAFNPCAGIDR